MRFLLDRARFFIRVEKFCRLYKHICGEGLINVFSLIIQDFAGLLMNQKITDYSATVPLPGAIDNPAKPSSEAHTSSYLSQTAFANPNEFLQVLKSDFDRIAKSGSAGITQTDLVLYSQHGDDARGRAAAAIAAKHFDELQQISFMKGKPHNLSKDQLDSDIDYINNNIGAVVSQRHSEGAKVMVEGAVGVKLCADVALGTVECPPVAIAFGVLAAVCLGANGYVAKKMFDVKKEEQKHASDDQRMVRSWLSSS